MKDETRSVTLRKFDNGEDIIFLVELNGEDTRVGIFENQLNHIHTIDGCNEAMDRIVFNLSLNNYIITNKEKLILGKLLQCMSKI